MTSENVLRNILTKKYGKAAAAFPAGPEDGLAAAAAAMAAPPTEAAAAAAAATADGTLTPTQVFEGYPAGCPEEDGQPPSAQGDVTPAGDDDDVDDSDPAWAAAAAATPTRSTTAPSIPLTPAAAAATTVALTAASGSATVGLGSAAGSADQSLHPKLLEVLHGVHAQLYVHSESIKEINGKGPAAGSPKAGHGEVRDMFKQLLAGKHSQRAKTEKLASYVGKGIQDVRQEVALKTDSLNDKVNQVQADFEMKFMQLEKKYGSRSPPLGCRTPRLQLLLAAAA